MTSETISGTSVTQATSCEDIGFTYADDKNPVHAPTKVTINGEAITTYEYSKTGNRVSKIGESETTTYESNDDNMIYKITMNGVETQFLYDADSKRVKKTQGDHSTLYFGEDFELINGTPTLYVFAGNLRIARLTDTETIYYHKDHLGSTNAISQTDGTIIDSNGYLPYGLDRSDNDLLQTSSYKFTDQEQDAGTGLYNYDARLYDPTLGQFIMADTLVPDMYNPQSLNRYAYCLNNPVKYTDPDGHAATIMMQQMQQAQMANNALASTGAAYSSQHQQNLAYAYAKIGRLMNPKPLALAIINLLRGEDDEDEQDIDPRERGRKSEERILDELGEDKNTEKVSSDEGNSIPDYINDDEIGEIKDTKAVYDTKQIRIQRDAAKKKGKSHVVHVGKNTHISKNVEKKGSKVEKHDDLGPKDKK